MTQEASNQLIDKIKVILKGIDQTEIESADGWWETSTGAKFGAEALKQILELLAQTQEPVACAECERLKDALKRANGLAEHFERAWYLRGDEIELLKEQTEQEPVAWRTFDGEGGYEYRSYEDNESYADDWNKRNPNHVGWVDELYTHSQRTWVDLTDEEIQVVAKQARSKDHAVTLTNKLLKEKNT
jgi:hypothetical protein